MVCVHLLELPKQQAFVLRERWGLGTLDKLYLLWGGVGCQSHTPALKVSTSWVDRGPPILASIPPLRTLACPISNSLLRTHGELEASDGPSLLEPSSRQTQLNPLAF